MKLMRITWDDAAALAVFERKILRKIFGPVRVGDDFRIRFNSDMDMTCAAY